MLGLPYDRPAAYTRDYLEVLDAALHGPGQVDVENDTFTVHNLLDLGPVAPLPVLLTGDPEAPPTLPGYSSADNSTGLTAALGLLAQIVSGRGGQIDVSLYEVMLSQLNYHAAALAAAGHPGRRRPRTARGA